MRGFGAGRYSRGVGLEGKIRGDAGRDGCAQDFGGPPRMDRWDFVLLAIGGYVAVRALVRLMLARRNQLAEALLAEAEQSRRAKDHGSRAGGGEQAGG